MSVPRRIIARGREWIGTLLLGGLLGYVLASDVRFCMTAERGEAVVRRVSPPDRGGSTVATVEQTTATGRVPGEIRGWFWHPREGDVIPTVYPPDQPARPVIDQFGRRHARLMTALGFFFLVAAGEAVARRTRCRVESLDCRMSEDRVPSDEVLFT